MIETNYKDLFNIDKEILDEIDPNLYSFLEFWKSNKKEIDVQTSGSTGIPKKIKISKEQMVASANATINHFNLKKNCTVLCCLPLKYIGGKMMIVRGVILKARILIIKPKAIPFKKINNEIDLLAITPLQLYNLLKQPQSFSNIKLTLIGGGKISEQVIEEIQSLPNQFFQSYGMTETVSHIAVRNLKNYFKNPNYQCLNGNTIDLGKNGQIIIKSDYLNIKSITTNDIGLKTDNQSFILKGRKGFIINSGGLKIDSNNIKNELKKTLKSELFFIDKIKCNKLGEKMILIASDKINLLDIKISINNIKDKKRRPKEVYIIDKFIFNNNQKIDILKTKERALNSKKINI